MSKDYLQRSFFQHGDAQISSLVSRWQGGKLTTARGNRSINTTATTPLEMSIGKVVVFSLSDIEGVPTQVIHEVKRGEGAAGIREGEGVGTFLAFQSAMMMIEWARTIDNQNTFQLAIQAPPGKNWSRLVNLMEFDRTITIPLRGGDIVMPGKRY